MNVHICTRVCIFIQVHSITHSTSVYTFIVSYPRVYIYIYKDIDTKYIYNYIIMHIL